MGGRIVELLSSPHRAAEALMPWLLNGTLKPAERRKLDAHLRDCATCRAELERQHRLATLYCDVAAAQPQVDGSAVFARLETRLDAEAAPAARRLAPTLGWRIVAALQFCVIVALAWTVWLLMPGIEPDAGPTAYRGLAASSSPARGDAIVFFAAEAAELDLRRALRRAGARVVDGPTAAGAYVLGFERGSRETALAVLRGERIVVRVEPLTSDGGPSSAPRD